MLFSIYDINVVIEVWCALFSVVGLLCVGLFVNAAQRSVHWYRRSLSLMFVFNMLGSLGDAAACISRGQLTTLGWYGTHLGLAVRACSLFLLLGAFCSYFCARLDKGGKLDLWVKIAWAFCTTGIVLSLVGFFYTIDPVTNLYHRSQLFWVSQVLCVCVQIGNFAVLLHSREVVSTATFSSMIAYILLPTVAFLAQTSVQGLSLNQMALTVSLMMLFVDLQSFLARNMARQQETLAQRERELTDSRVQIMVSQIQPHFLYNTLDSIYYLCGKDAARAREAISKFSDYLRVNLRSLRSSSPVAFKAELEHVQNYLELEQMSSDDTINFVLDVQTTGFMLPALSLQPLVENAIKHGVTKRPEGGTVTLRTRELEDCFEVVVEDDGVGFDMTAEPDTSRPHVGMQNVRQRLESMCKGTLTVESTPGVGTRAVVRIPRGGG